MHELARLKSWLLIGEDGIDGEKSIIAKIQVEDEVRVI